MVPEIGVALFLRDLLALRFLRGLRERSPDCSKWWDDGHRGDCPLCVAARVWSGGRSATLLRRLGGLTSERRVAAVLKEFERVFKEAAV